MVRWKASCSFRLTGTAVVLRQSQFFAFFLQYRRQSGIPRTLQKLSDILNSHERGRVRTLVLLEPTKPSTQLNGRNLVAIFSSMVQVHHTRNMESSCKTYQVLQFPRPDVVVLVEWVLVSHSLQAGNILLLSNDCHSRIIKDRLDCFLS